MMPNSPGIWPIARFGRGRGGGVFDGRGPRSRVEEYEKLQESAAGIKMIIFGGLCGIVPHICS